MTSATPRALYDVPGPTARHRHRLYAALTVLVIVAVAAAVAAVLGGKGQFERARWEFLREPGTYRAIWSGLTATLSVAVVAIALSLVFGAVFAVARLSRRAWLRSVSVVVVEFFRAVPLVLLILFVYLAYSADIGRFWALTVALVLYNGSVLAEIFRAGIAAVPAGQAEAAYALGLRRGQVMRIVLMPQAVRVMLPAIISQSVVALKDTALGVIIGYAELASVARLLYVNYNNPLQAGLVIAAIYMAINYTLSKAAAVVSARQGRTRAAAAPGEARVDSEVGQPVL